MGLFREKPKSERAMRNEQYDAEYKAIWEDIFTEMSKNIDQLPEESREACQRVLVKERSNKEAGGTYALDVLDVLALALKVDMSPYNQRFDAAHAKYYPEKDVAA